MMFAVSFGEFVKKIVAASLVDARRKLPDCFSAQRACVHQRSDKCARSFGPMIITSITSTSSSDVKKASRGKNGAIPS
jgi:hypothetical protein